MNTLTAKLNEVRENTASKHAIGIVSNKHAGFGKISSGGIEIQTIAVDFDKKLETAPSKTLSEHTAGFKDISKGNIIKQTEEELLGYVGYIDNNPSITPKMWEKHLQTK